MVVRAVREAGVLGRAVIICVVVAVQAAAIIRAAVAVLEAVIICVVVAVQAAAIIRVAVAVQAVSIIHGAVEIQVAAIPCRRFRRAAEGSRDEQGALTKRPPA